jgi:ribulose-phosphate 3-epimerase
MSVNPGFGGQSFIAHRAAEARARAPSASKPRSSAPGARSCSKVDGGIKVENIAAAARAGADTFVAGSAIFGAEDYSATIAKMRAELALVQ